VSVSFITSSDRTREWECIVGGIKIIKKRKFQTKWYHLRRKEGKRKKEVENSLRTRTIKKKEVINSH